MTEEGEKKEGDNEFSEEEFRSELESFVRKALKDRFEDVAEEVVPLIAAASKKGSPEAALAMEALKEQIKKSLQKAEGEGSGGSNEHLDELSELEAEVKRKRLERERKALEEEEREKAEAEKEERKLRNKLKKGIEKVSGKAEAFQAGVSQFKAGVSQGLYTAFFLLTLTFHYFDAFAFQFSLNRPVLLTRFAFYLTVSMLLHFKTKDSFFFYVGGLEVVMPLVLLAVDNFAAFLAPYAFFLWVITPAFALYISYMTKKRLYSLWLFALLVLAIITLISRIVSPFFPNVSGQLDVAKNLGEALRNIKESFKGFWKALTGGFLIGVKKFPLVLEKTINYATGGYYASLIEDQQGEPVGVYINSFQPMSEVFFEDEPVYLWAEIKGKSFKKPVSVSTSCYTSEGVEGETNPKTFEIFDLSYETVQCRFDKLLPGRHVVNLAVGFNFETWAYVTYTFVNQETRKNLLMQGKDINQELKVDPALRPVQTPGPVGVGMSSNVPQPVGLSFEKGLNVPFGVTLENVWTDGSITRVKEFVVVIPSLFSLEDCTLKPDGGGPLAGADPLCQEDPDRCDQNLKTYSFKRGVGNPRTFKTFLCRLRLDKGVNPEEVIPLGQQKAQYTFVVIARYDYALSTSRVVEVKRLGK